MSEAAAEVVTVESAAPPEVQARAEKMGWIPATRFKGDAATFVDADEYIKRGETVLPIVKEHNRRLEAQVTRLESDNRAIAATLAKAQTAIEEIEERHTVATQKAVEKAKADVKAQLAAASEAGDHIGVAELTNQLVELNTAVPEEKKAAPVVVPQQRQEVVDPELVAWNTENTWFGTDTIKTQLALAIATELRQKGERATGAAFYDKVKLITEKRYVPDGEAAPTVDKVGGARNGGGSEDNRSGGEKRSFSDLPADAKAACQADTKNFVGPNKKYKTAAEWHSRYAEIYFEQEA